MPRTTCIPASTHGGASESFPGSWMELGSVTGPLEGYFGWYLQNPVRFERIIPMPGRVGFFQVDESSPQLARALAAVVS